MSRFGLKAKRTGGQQQVMTLCRLFSVPLTGLLSEDTFSIPPLATLKGNQDVAVDKLSSIRMSGRRSEVK